MRRAMADGSANDCPPLKLGIYSTNNIVNPHPPIARGLRMVVTALKNAGHQVSINDTGSLESGKLLNVFWSCR